MLIKGWTDAKRLPRLGTIALGVKDHNGIPQAVDYFVVPPEVQKAYSDIQPTELRELDVMFPSEELEVIMPAYLRRYGKVAGLICRGDGELASLKLSYAKEFGAKEYGIEHTNGSYIYKITGEKLQPIIKSGKSWLQIPCDPTCSFRIKGTCRPIVHVNVLLPKVPGVLGVYTIVTSSWNSFTNINNALRVLKGIAGRISFINCRLRVGMQTVNPEISGGKSVQRQVPILSLDLGDHITLEAIMQHQKQQALITSGAMLAPVAPMPGPGLDLTVEEIDEDERPELLYQEQNEAAPGEEEAIEQVSPAQSSSIKDTEDTNEDEDTIDTKKAPNLNLNLDKKPKKSDADQPTPQTVSAANANHGADCEFKALSRGQIIPTRDKQHTAWIKAVCTHGSLEGSTFDLFVDPNAQDAVQLVGLFVPGDIFAAIPDQVFDHRIVTSIVEAIGSIGSEEQATFVQ